MTDGYRRQPNGNEYQQRYQGDGAPEFRERVDYSQIPPDSMVCWNCQKFERRTHFCRANPPQIVVFQDGPENKVSSKFPVVMKPNMDYCENEFILIKEQDDEQI